MADEPMADEPMAEIRQAHAEARAEMDAWYTAHPNPQWRREHPFDADSVVANTHIYITIPALLTEVERLRAREAALRKAGATLLETVPDYFAHMHEMTTEQGAAVIGRMNDALDALRDLLHN